MTTVALEARLIRLAVGLCLLSLKGRCREGCRGVSGDHVGLVPEDLGNLKAIRNDGIQLNVWGHDCLCLNGVKPGLSKKRSNLLDCLEEMPGGPCVLNVRKMELDGVSQSTLPLSQPFLCPG